jgi:hypothetical protein
MASPANPASFWDNSVAKNFGPAATAGTWQNQGFDRNGKILTEAPPWPDPAKGNFG